MESSKSDLLEIDGHAFIIINQDETADKPFLHSVVDQMSSQLLPENDPVINLALEQVKSRLGNIDLADAASNTFDNAVDSAVEFKHKGNDGYFCHYVTKPAQKAMVRAAGRTAWAQKESAYYLTKDAVLVVSQPENMQKLKLKLIEAYQTAEKGTAIAAMIDAFATHIADVIVDDRYKNNDTYLASWLYAPSEKAALRLAIAKALGRRLA